MGTGTMNAVEPVLSVEGLQARFDSPDGIVPAVNNVSFVVGEGRRLGVVGESGSGKTQTFFSILGLSTGAPGVVAGRARLAGVDLLADLDRFVTARGKDVDGWSRLHQERLRPVLGVDVAILFQDPTRSLIPYWTIERHFRDVVARRGGHQPPTHLLESLGFLDAPRILNAFPHELSGGEAQRALLAITMAMQPRLLIADEPTTGLDTINQARVLEALRSVQRERRLAVVLISHDLAVVDSLVDDVLVMFAGRVVERISATALREEPDEALHPYTSALRESQVRRAQGLPIDPRIHAAPLARASSGCPYRLRCGLRPMLSADAQRQCEHEVPPEHAVSGTHGVACWGRRA